MGNITDAIRFFQEAIEKDESFIPARLALARGLLLNGDYFSAYDTVEEFIAHDVFGASATIIAADARFRAEQVEDSLRLLSNPRWQNNALVNLDAGIVLVSQGMSRDAATKFRRALRIEPTLSEAYHGLALCYIKEGIPKKAIREFKLGLATGGMSKKAVRNLGRLYNEIGNYDEAIKLLSPKVSASSNDQLSRFILAASYFSNGDYASAKEHTLKILEAVDDEHNDLPEGVSYDTILNNVGACYVSEFDLEGGLRWYERAAKENGQADETIRHNVIKAHILQGQADRAKELIDQIEISYGVNAKSQSSRTWYYHITGLFDQELDLLKQMAESNDLDSFGYANLAFLQGEWSLDTGKAMETVRHGLKRNPKNSHLLNALTYYNIQRGNLDRARETMSLPDWPSAMPTAIATEGFFHLAAGDFHKAVTYYNNAKRAADPSFQLVIEQKKRLEMGRYYLRQEQHRQALRELRQVVSIESVEKIYRHQAQQLIAEIGA